MVKIGDIVRFLNSVGGGRVTRIEGKMAFVDEDGFETPVLIKDCVVVSEAPAAFHQPENTQAKASLPEAPASPEKVIVDDETIEFEETPEGEKLNVVLGYEPSDIKRLSKSQYETYIVNDSNYTLYLSYLTKAADDDMWKPRFIGTVDAGIVLYLGELTREDLPEMGRVMVQFIAYKKDKPFAPKAPVSVEQRFDATKLLKLHCFQPNPYFDTPVIAIDIVTDDVPAQVVNVSAKDVAEGMMAGIDRVAPDKDTLRADAPVRKKKSKSSKPTDQPLVVDLHINRLLDDTRGLSNSDMLNVQIDAFRKVMDEHRRHYGKKIVFIHGKGEGVLRQALLKELNYRYRGCEVQDASFREYGFGASQVTIRQKQ